MTGRIQSVWLLHFPAALYRTVRSELAEHAPLHAADVALKAYRTESFRLLAIEQAMELVERALRGG